MSASEGGYDLENVAGRGRVYLKVEMSTVLEPSDTDTALKPRSWLHFALLIRRRSRCLIGEMSC